MEITVTDTITNKQYSATITKRLNPGDRITAKSPNTVYSYEHDDPAVEVLDARCGPYTRNHPFK